MCVSCSVLFCLRSNLSFMYALPVVFSSACLRRPLEFNCLHSFLLCILSHSIVYEWNKSRNECVFTLQIQKMFDRTTQPHLRELRGETDLIYSLLLWHLYGLTCKVFFTSVWVRCRTIVKYVQQVEQKFFYPITDCKNTRLAKSGNGFLREMVSVP